MPFVTKDHREEPCLGCAGDRCYIYYQDIMKEWRANPRWTTVDIIAADLFPDELQRAHFLAFMVFFQMHVIPYEEQKRVENGEV